MDNSIDEIEEYIRPPDEVKRERLIDDTRTDFEKDIDTALDASLEEFKEQQKIQDKYEEDLMTEFLSESKKRKGLFEKLLIDINRLTRYDIEIKEIFEIIEPIIELYCNQYIEVIRLDKITYDKIFNMLNKIRIDKIGLNILKNIIIME